MVMRTGGGEEKTCQQRIKLIIMSWTNEKGVEGKS